MDETITSRSNPKIKQVRALWRRKQREAEGLFIVEGIWHIGEAIEAGAPIEAIFYAPELLKSRFAQELVEGHCGTDIPCFRTSAEVFASIAGKENPQGILAVVRESLTRLEDLKPGQFPWGVALVSPQDPGNVGTILRTIDAAGASGLLLLDNSVDPYHPSAVRASMGAIFWHPVATATFEEFTTWARDYGYHIYGASAHGEVSYREVSAYQRPLVLLMGSEREGLTSEQAAVCERLVYLPMRGRVTSLNLAIATGVMLYAMMDLIR